MLWNKARILERLYYWWEFRNYVADYKFTEEWVGVPKRKRSKFEPKFITEAINNADFDAAFGLLDEFEQSLLIKLYMDGGYDNSTQKEKEEGKPARIEIRQEVFDSVVKETGLAGKELMKRVNDAITVMMEYLNK